MEQKSKTTKKSTTLRSAIILRNWGHYQFKFFPGSAANKPHVYFSFVNPATNKSKKIIKKTGLSTKMSLAELKQEAKELIEDIIDLLSKGWNPITNEFNDLPISPLSTIGECLTYWLKKREEKVSNNAMKPKALKMNKYLASYFRDWLISNNYLFRQPKTFNHFDIDTFLQTTANRRNWNKVSYNCYRTDLGTFFNFLVTLKIVSENPVRLSEKKNTKRDSSRFRIYEKEELQNTMKLMATDKSYFSLYVASKLVFYLNIRPVEITRIQVCNIDHDKRTLTLTPDKTKNGNEAVFSLTDEIYNLLDELIANAPDYYYLFGCRCKPSLQPVHVDYFGAKWRAFRAKYNLPKHLLYYSLKHSSNYWDIQAGASFEEIRQRNRHSNLQVTTLYIKERLLKDIITPTTRLQF